MARVPPLRDEVALTAGYHSPQIDVSVRLNTNESPFSPPRRWINAVIEEIKSVPFNRYPDREAGELREALGNLHGVGAERIFVAKGSNEVLQCLMLAFGGPGRRAAIFDPTYLLHSHIARLVGTEVVSGSRARDFRLELSEVSRVVDESDPEVIFVCSPNNPTGGCEPRETIEQVVALAGGLVVVDEAYGQFAPWSAVDYVEDGVEGLAVCRTFSKTWAMAGCRLGYLVAEEDVVRACERVALPYHVDTFAQIAGKVALDFYMEMDRRVATIIYERRRVESALAGLEVDYWPSDANFVLFRPRTMDAEKVWEGLVERSVLVRNCSSWPGLRGCLRVTMGTPNETDAFVEALGDVLDKGGERR